ncbi:MAG TPA: glycoside hydrolase family 172 protein [Opitutus sp.]|nr:glycoside hydrolase family 172 protein [Opitutus sp.]
MKTSRLVSVLALLACGLTSLRADELFQMAPKGVEPRWASPENPRGEKGGGATTLDGRKGRPSVPLKAGDSLVLAEASGTSGTIRRIWITIEKRSPQMLRSLRIDCYWDGAKKPAVSAPLGDFFGVGLGRMAAFQSALFSDPEGRSFNCFVPMPFRTGMKIVLANESSVDLAMVFYDVDYTVGDRHGDDALYFHAWFNRENPTQLRRDYTILPKVAGRGRFLGANIGVIADRQYHGCWWGEGEVKVYLDGDTTNPTLCGTGSEDYTGSAWGLGTFAHAYAGCTIADAATQSYAFYRFHVPDPIYFRSGARVTIQQIGCWDPKSIPVFRDSGRTVPSISGGGVNWNDPKLPPYGLFERQDDVSSCAYFYLDRADDDLPPLPPVAERTRGLAAE